MKTIHKIFLVFTLSIFTLFGSTLLAQSARIGFAAQEFNSLEMAGIIKHDAQKVIKKLKITEESTTKEIVKHLQDYNAKMDELSVIHSKTLEDLKIEFSKKMQIAIQNRDRGQMSEVRDMLKEIIPPIRQEVNEYRNVLNESLESILSEKQNKKWLKHQKQNRLQDLLEMRR
jgi:SMC interacting uncharacterized protein involved in chromosome segregation